LLHHWNPSIRWMRPTPEIFPLGGKTEKKVKFVARPISTRPVWENRLRLGPSKRR
jgi:hypothetical protein